MVCGGTFYDGIGVTLGREFGRDALTVIPAPGAFTLAAARLGRETPRLISPTSPLGMCLSADLKTLSLLPDSLASFALPHSTFLHVYSYVYFNVNVVYLTLLYV